jgi:hypothetical protein
MTDFEPDLTVAADGSVSANTPAGAKILGEQFEEITVPRGGIAFAGGWCAPSSDIYNLLDTKPLTKKQLQKRLDETQRALTREREKTRRLTRKVDRLLKIIRRMA